MCTYVCMCFLVCGYSPVLLAIDVCPFQFLTLSCLVFSSLVLSCPLFHLAFHILQVSYTDNGIEQIDDVLNCADLINVDMRSATFSRDMICRGVS